MSELIITLIAVLIILALYVVERAVVFSYKLKKAKEYQNDIIEQERHLLNRLTLLLAIDQPHFLQDAIFQEQRKKLYSSPTRASYNEINTILDKGIKSPHIDQTLELGLVAEIKGLRGLIDTKYQNYHQYWENVTKTPKLLLISFFCRLFRSICLTNQNFQKGSKSL